MAIKKYVCTNYGNCDVALSKEVLEIEEGEEVICRGCRRTDSLQPVSGEVKRPGPAGQSRAALVLAGVAVLLLLVAGAGWRWSQSPDPQGADSALIKFFPRIEK